VEGGEGRCRGERKEGEGERKVDEGIEERGELEMG